MAVESEIQLKPWAERKFEQAWRHRVETGGRERTSRQDFRAGYVAALVDNGVSVAFQQPQEAGV